MNSETSANMAVPPEPQFIPNIEELRSREYAYLKDHIYLDNAGSALYASSVLRACYERLANPEVPLGNPHSDSVTSRASTAVLAETRTKILRLFRAAPDKFDVVFCANSTSGIKLVADCMVSAFGWRSGWEYVLPRDAHTSLIGVRELSGSTVLYTPRIVGSDDPSNGPSDLTSVAAEKPTLVALTGQSNFTGLKYEYKRVVRDLRKVAQRGKCGENGNRSGYGKTDENGNPGGAGSSNFLILDSIPTVNSNFSGSAFSSGPIFTLLDAAGLCASAIPDFSDATAAPDFTAVSFYKIFGYPDLGALIVRKSPETVALLRHRAYFGGGTVEAVSADSAFAPKRQLPHEMCEDGTVAFHTVAQLGVAIDVFPDIFGSLEAVTRHTSALTSHCHRRLISAASASSTATSIEFYTDAATVADPTVQGPILTFNLRRSDGSYIGYKEIEQLAIVSGFSIRSGSLCNSGATSDRVGFGTDFVVSAHSRGHICGDEMDLFQGKPTGAVRVSFGAHNTLADVDAFVRFLSVNFFESESVGRDGRNAEAVEVNENVTNGNYNRTGTKERKAEISEIAGSINNHKYDLNYTNTETAESSVPPAAPVNSTIPQITELVVFPIKSCSPMIIKQGRWPLDTNRGGCLAWDREFCLVDLLANRVMGQKQFGAMAWIFPLVDPEGKKMTVAVKKGKQDNNDCGSKAEIPTATTSAPHCHGGIDELIIDLLPSAAYTTETRAVAGADGEAQIFTGQGIPEFFTAITGVACTLARCHPEAVGSFARKSPFLLVSEASVRAVNAAIAETATAAAPQQVSAHSFRGNVLIDGVNLPPYQEDAWQTVRIGGSAYELTGPCQRCHMVNVNQQTGRLGKEPYATLARTRKFDGKIYFGQYMRMKESEEDGGENSGKADGVNDGNRKLWLTIGDSIHVVKLKSG